MVLHGIIMHKRSILENRVLLILYIYLSGENISEQIFAFFLFISVQMFDSVVSFNLDKHMIL